MAGRAHHVASRSLAVIAMAVVLALGGCGGDDPAPAAPPGVVERVAERGPVKVTLRADGTTVTVGSPITVTIIVEVERGVDVEVPRYTGALGPFRVRSAERPPDVPQDDRRVWTHTYRLDTFEVGDLEIPAVTVPFNDRRPVATGGEPIEGEVITEPLPIRVESVLRDDDNEGTFRDIRGALAVPLEPKAGDDGDRRAAMITLAVIAVVTAVLAAIIVWLVRRWRAPAAPEPPVPAHEWALAELERLEREGLVGKGRYLDFYSRLSGVVREYIERRFGMMAPERTTEEFLREARRSPVLNPGHQTLLASFLRAADMVKFAMYAPSAEESTSAFAAGRGFVMETAPGAEDAAAPVVSGVSGVSGASGEAAS